MKRPKYLDLPQNVNIRCYSDGSFGIPRRNREIEAVLDRIGERIPNQLRWWPKLKDTKSFEKLKHLVEGKTCHIVGKGPSLDNLTEEHFGDGAIITLNEAIHKVESLDLQNPIMAIQQDVPLGAASWSEKGMMLVPPAAAHIYHNHPDLYTYTYTQLSLVDRLSVSVAIGIAGYFKATDIKMLCFDAYTHKNLEYAKVIGHPSSKGGAPERFLKNNLRMEKQLAYTGLPYVFITPTAPLQPSACTPEPSLDSPPEHHASAHTGSLESKPDTED